MMALLYSPAMITTVAADTPSGRLPFGGNFTAFGMQAVFITGDITFVITRLDSFLLVFNQMLNYCFNCILDLKKKEKQKNRSNQITKTNYF